MFSFFSRININQISLISGLNQMAKDLKEASFDETGICAALSNIYINYASQGKRDEFFKKIKLIINRRKDSIPSKELELFFKEVEKEVHDEGIFLKNIKCQDAFSFVSNNQAQLTDNIKRIIKNFQQYNKNVYAHITLGHMHSFVLEQNIKNDKFTYVVYDPNNPDLPRILTTIDEIISELNAIIKRIQLSELALYDYLAKNKNLLFTFYVYPVKQVEEKDELINRLQNKIEYNIKSFHDDNKYDCDLIFMSTDEEFKLIDLPGKAKTAYILLGEQLLYIEKAPKSYRVMASVTDKELMALTEKLKLPPIKLETGVKSKCLIECLSPEQLQVLISAFSITHEPKQLLDLHDAKWCLEKYSRNKMAKGIILSNLLALPNLLDEEKEIKKELEKHLLSSDLLSKDYKEVPCYSYSKGSGNVSLLHETARIGDLQAVRLLLKTSDPLLENYSKMTPLECAMSEGSARIVNEMFSFMYTSNEQSSSNYQLDYERFLGKAYKYLNLYSCEDPLYTAFRRNLKLFYGHEDIEEHNRKLLQGKSNLRIA
jgi:hypothetical protein